MDWRAADPHGEDMIDALAVSRGLKADEFQSEGKATVSGNAWT